MVNRFQKFFEFLIFWIAPPLIIFFASFNKNASFITRPAGALLVLLAICCFSIVASLLFKLISKNNQTSLISTFVVLVAFFQYGTFRVLLIDIHPIFSLGRYSYLVMIVAVPLLLCLIHFFLKKVKIANSPIQLPIFFVFLFNVAIGLKNVALLLHHENVLEHETVEATNIKMPRPNIYHIVLDSFPSPETAKYFLNIDFSPLAEFLKKNNFTLPLNPLANYPFTLHSLSSHLNYELISTPYPSERALNSNMFNSKLSQTLRNYGYKLINISSGVGNGTDYNPYFDINLVSNIFDQFFITTILNTPIRPIFNRFVSNEKSQTVRFAFDALVKLSASKSQPFYVFTHQMIPHGPNIFQPDGTVVTPEEISLVPMKARVDKDALTHEIQFLLNSIPVIVDNILKHDPSAAIVLMSDHGGYTTRIGWNNLSDIALKERFSPFLAIRPSQNLNARIPDQISLVNVWPNLLNELFGTQLRTSEDHIFYVEYFPIEKYLDVTQRMKSLGLIN